MQPLETDGIRLAATVMLLRDNPSGMQVYMVQRNGRGAFPDLHVFPGGKVDEEDYAPGICDKMSDEAASQLLGISAGGIRYWIAVARECFEECGVLLARRDGKLLDFADAQLQQHFAQARSALLADEISFETLCRDNQLTVATDHLAYFSHWITPEMAPRRFNTRFFVAAMPADQNATYHRGEATDEEWIDAHQALQKHAQGEWQMIDPTLRSLETLSQFTNVDEALQGINRADHLMPLTPELNQQGMQPLR